MNLCEAEIIFNFYKFVIVEYRNLCEAENIKFMIIT